jgi:hypothetical protein
MLNKKECEDLLNAIVANGDVTREDINNMIKESQDELYFLSGYGINIDDVKVDHDTDTSTFYITIPDKLEFKINNKEASHEDIANKFNDYISNNISSATSNINIKFRVNKGLVWGFDDISKTRGIINDMISTNPLYPYNSNINDI